MFFNIIGWKNFKKTYLFNREPKTTLKPLFWNDGLICHFLTIYGNGYLFVTFWQNTVMGIKGRESLFNFLKTAFFTYIGMKKGWKLIFSMEKQKLHLKANFEMMFLFVTFWQEYGNGYKGRDFLVNFLMKAYF